MPAVEGSEKSAGPDILRSYIVCLRQQIICWLLISEIMTWIDDTDV